MHFMDQLHKDLSKKHEWYSRWHQIPHISAIHLFFLIGVGCFITSSLTEVVATLEPNQVVAAAAAPDTTVGRAEGYDYGPWFAISLWKNCSHLTQQGHVFELQNAEGQSMLSECTPQVPQGPFDWHSGPVRFRLVKEPLPRHSEPHPRPSDTGNEHSN
jgi:hypothetical protein